MAPPSVPRPVSAGRPGKYYLPAFNIVATVPTLEGAYALEQGLMELIQYRGNSVACFNVAMGRAADDGSDPLKLDSVPCVVAAATRAQLFASVVLGSPTTDGAALLKLAAAADPALEPWESRFIAATAHFLEYDYDRATAACLAALEAEPFDGFSARLLLITTYLGSHQDALCDGFAAVTSAYEHAIANQQTGPYGAHALHLALPYWMAWAAFGYEESRRDVAAGERYARRAIDLTVSNNATYFPTHNADADQPGAVGALRAAAPQYGFTCVFAVHVVLHCYEARGDPQGALDALATFDAPLWELAVHLAGHLRWHVATFKLEVGNVEGAVADFQAYLSDPAAGDPYQLADTTAFAWRLWNVWNYFTVALQHEGGSMAWTSSLTRDAMALVDSVMGKVQRHWEGYDALKLTQVPFFAAHRHVTSVLSKSIRDEVFVPWSSNVIQKLLRVPTSRASDATAPSLSRVAFCAALQQAAESVTPEAAMLALLTLARDEAPTRPLSVRLHRAGLPMGGSIAQMRLITFPLLLALLLARREGAITTLRAHALQAFAFPLLAQVLQQAAPPPAAAASTE